MKQEVKQAVGRLYQCLATRTIRSSLNPSDLRLVLSRLEELEKQRDGLAADSLIFIRTLKVEAATGHLKNLEWWAQQHQGESDEDREMRHRLKTEIERLKAEGVFLSLQAFLDAALQSAPDKTKGELKT